jgi:hypothetical protein
MKGCWRLTDNRHWNSPARMSDGRSFTNYKSSGLIAKEIQDRIGIDKGKQTYRDYLQKNGSNLLEEERMKSFANVFTSNVWANGYVPPPPKHTIEASKRDGMDIHETNMTGGIGFGPQIDNVRKFEMQTPYSDCVNEDLEDPRWGISPDTLVLTKRPAASHGGNVWGWLDSNERA